MIDKYLTELASMDANACLAWALEHFDTPIVFTTSLGAEDQVILDMLAKLCPEPRQGTNLRIVSLDTGRLPQETYDVLEANRIAYPQLPITIYFPRHEAVEAMHSEYGSQPFRQSIELRKACCAVRKVEPLARALAGAKLWISGLRREQASTRGELEVISWDQDRGLYKLAPLWNWSHGEVFTYLDRYQVPRNELHKKGYPSIGCAPCTRAVQAGEDERAGRWWWESPEHKECGLHLASKNNPVIKIQPLGSKG